MRGGGSQALGGTEQARRGGETTVLRGMAQGKRGDSEAIMGLRLGSSSLWARRTRALARSCRLARPLLAALPPSLACNPPRASVTVAPLARPPARPRAHPSPLPLPLELSLPRSTRACPLRCASPLRPRPRGPALPCVTGVLVAFLLASISLCAFVFLPFFGVRIRSWEGL